MRIPRVSVNALFAAMIIVAFDCVVLRSLQVRSGLPLGSLAVIVLCTLPMANILAVVLTTTIQRRGKARSRSLGFQASGVIAILATLILFDRFLDILEFFVTKTAAGRWIQSFPGWESCFTYLILPVGFLLSQLAFAWLAGSMTEKAISRWKGRPAPSPLPHQRLSLASLVVLFVLVALPSLALEGYLHVAVDRVFSRRLPGSVAVVNLTNMQKWQAALATQGTTPLVTGTKVRIEEDSNSTLLGVIRTPQGDHQGDMRLVSVTLLDGPDVGQTAWVYHCLLQP